MLVMALKVFCLLDLVYFVVETLTDPYFSRIRSEFMSDYTHYDLMSNPSDEYKKYIAEKRVEYDKVLTLENALTEIGNIIIPITALLIMFYIVCAMPKVG